MKTLIVIPAFNEEKSIGVVLSDLVKLGFRHILVVDDGSKDRTSEIAKNHQAVVVRHVVNRGLGAALGTGFAFALANNYDILVTCDADGQHDPKDIKNLIAPIISGSADVVVGSRFLEFEKIPADRKVANQISNIATYALYGVWTSDSQSGLRAFNKKAINLIKIKTDRMEVSSEFFKEIRQNKLRYKEINIKAIYSDYSLKNSKQGNVGLASISIGFKMLLRLFR